MLIIPIRTDAPLYYGPWATIAIIAVNVVVAIALGIHPVEREQWGLTYGDGLHPAQWITSNFIHADPFHLVGNMVFLFAFGLVVEGKIGWLAFLPVYLGVGGLQCAMEQWYCQSDMLGGSYGASAAIFGLMAICMVWAPRNEMTCWWWMGGSIGGERDVSILSLSLIYIGIEIAYAWWRGLMISTPMLHLSGALVGLIVGAAMVKLQWVDCENWDLFAVMAGREGQESPRKKPKKKAVRKEAKADPSIALKAVEHFLEEGNAAAAAKAYEDLQEKHGQAELSETLLGKLIKALNDGQQWEASAPRMAEFVKRFPEKADRMRLKLAQVYVDQLHRPYRAQAVLREIEPGSLNEALEKAKRSLEKKTAKAIEEAPLELEGAE